MKPSRAAQQFDIDGRFVLINSVGRGNVNDTYEVVFRAGARVERIILQRINTRVFRRPDYIMVNMRTVTEHVRQRVEAEQDGAAREWGFPRIIPTLDGEDFFVDDSGQYWRAMTMIEASSSYERVRSVEDALEAGTVLGCFHRLISDLDVTCFHDTLPGFHQCPGYLAEYDATLAREDSDTRPDPDAPEVRRLKAFVEARRGLAGRLEDALARGEIGSRLIHGDPKLDNIMIDDFTGKGIGIIDLDTVKPGLIHYDFGDALRSVCNEAGEDAADLKEVIFNVDLCEAFVRGYLAEARQFLTDADRYYLYDAVRLLPFELGLRFFSDYLAGDVYFKVRFEEHNLNRARVQFKLCESVELNERAIREVLTDGD